MFGKGGELFVDNRFVAVAGLHRRLEIVGNDGRHNTLEVLKGVLTGLDQVFLALGPYGLAVSIMTERKYGHEHFGLLDLARHLVDNRESVAREVDVHLVGRIVLDMTHDSGMEPVLPDGTFEYRFLKTIRMTFPILIEELAHGHALARKTCHITRYQGIKFELTLRRLAMPELRAAEHLTELFLRKLKQSLCRLAA